MAFGTRINLVPGVEREWQSGFTKYKQRVYECGPHATLAKEDLEIGDTLRDDSTYEIVNARMDTDRKTGQRFATVAGMSEGTV